MSNQTLHNTISQALEDVKSGKLTPKAAAAVLLDNGNALEGMPYELIKQMKTLAMDLERAQADDEDGSFPDLATALFEAETWLKKVPLDI